MSSDYVYMSGGWADLEKYGIAVLTGEACAYSMRILCDLNEDGVTLLAGYFGSNITFKEGSNWNPMVYGKPSVASVMLPYSIVLDLRKYIMFHVEKVKYMAIQGAGGSALVGANDFDYLRTNLSDNWRIVTNHALFGSHSNKEGRNVHAMSGRTI